MANDTTITYEIDGQDFEADKTEGKLKIAWSDFFNQLADISGANPLSSTNSTEP